MALPSFAVYYIQLLCVPWIWLGDGTMEAVCSPPTSLLLFASALWCIERKAFRTGISLAERQGRNPTPGVWSLTIPGLSALKAFIHFKNLTFHHCVYYLLFEDKEEFLGVLSFVIEYKRTAKVRTENDGFGFGERLKTACVCIMWGEKKEIHL